MIVQRNPSRHLEPLEQRIQPHHMVVIVRVRPLLTEHGDNVAEPNSSATVRFGQDRNGSWGVKVTDPFSRSVKPRKLQGFERVFGKDSTNQDIADHVLPPLLGATAKGSCGTLFAYGHTGSGKTYTVFNADFCNSEGETEASNPASASVASAEPGLWYFAAQRLIDIMPSSCLIKVNMFEIYNDEAFDLLDAGKKCTIREGEDKNTYVRSPPIVDPVTGAVRMESGKHQCARELNDIVGIVSTALKQRAVGNSTVHKSSSRSHALLELEIVSPELLEARDNLIQKQADLTPIGKRKETEYLRHASQAFRKNEETGQYEMVPGFDHSNKLLDELTVEFNKAQAIVDEAKEALEKVVAESHPCVGGVMLFADLAGAEYAGKLTSRISQTKAEEKQGREINKSLMALSACVRALSAGKAHVPFRNSKLTRILRRFLVDKDATSTVIATVSPASNHAAATLSTLSQAQIMARAEHKV